MSRTERIRRKDLRQDEFLTLSRRAVAYAETNRTTMLLVAGAALFVLVAVGAYAALRQSRETSAAQAFGRAHALFDGQKYTEAATAFQDAATTYSSTSYAALAQLEAANALLLADRRADAAQAYQAFLDHGAPADYLRQVALTRLGQIREQSGQPGEAVAAYAAAEEIPGPYAEEALAGHARAAEASGDSAGAKGLYEKFLEKYPESELRAVVVARLVALGGTPPGHPEVVEEGAAVAAEADAAAGNP